jgi:hypothetical protein
MLRVWAKIMAQTVHLHLRIRVETEWRGALLAFLREAVPFYETLGGARVRLLQSRDHPDRFIEVIEYESADRLRRDEERMASNDEMKVYLQRWRGLLAGAADVEAYDELTDQIHGSPT